MDPQPRWLPPAPPEPASQPPLSREDSTGAPPRFIPPDQPEPHQPTGDRTSRRGIIGVLIGVGALILNFGAKLKVLLLLLSKVKLFTTSASMLVSIGAYSLIWGWKFAVGIVLLLLVHELGHVFQLRREGIQASAPVFIPFLGAAVWAKSLGDDALAEARVGLAGPVLGSLGAAALVPVALLTGNDLFQALAFTGLFLNLFNLVPMLPLDGGRAMAAMAPWMWLVGLGVMVGTAFVFPNPILLLIVLLGALDTWRRWKQRRQGGEEQQTYYRVKPAHRLMVAGVYMGLIVALGFGMYATFLPRTIA